jgi:2-polyprenyl-3-methyl-5-hydroxy-6-metoxy-1,4-benzoquinol methylase
MPKKILYESAVHQFLWASKRLRMQLQAGAPAAATALASWTAALVIENPGPGAVRISWQFPVAGTHTLALKNAHFYTRGDAAVHTQRQTDAGLPFTDDQVMAANRAFFDSELRAMLSAATLFDPAALEAMFTREVGAEASAHDRKRAEESFHDEWAASEDVTKIDVRQRNEASTAPEMRHLRAALGDLRGRELLDVGCGLGEASVYFALEGATVTATDISPGMCAAAQRLAAANGVALATHVSAIEDLGLPAGRQFDIIYTGNTLHHADIAAMLDNVLPHLKPDGVFVSWDPVAYNPLINVYRALATEVRTVDEHPLRLRDVRAITNRFATAEVRWFWLTTLLIFILMAVVQWRSPNKERYWKKVIDEADRWAWLYRPLEKFDALLLRLLPFLRPLCWNVVIVARRPRRDVVV